MKVDPRIETIVPRMLVGMRRNMSFADDQTVHLWRSFMPQRNDVAQRVGGHVYSMALYPPHMHFQTLDLHSEFEKWAAVEVSHVEYDLLEA